VCLAAVAALFARPINLKDLRSRPDACRDYRQGMYRFEQVCLGLDDDVIDDCRPIVLTHGKKTEKAVVLYHGYTNCPRQYEKLALMFFERGYNVYVPLIPYHGLKDRETGEIGRLTLKDLREVCDSSVDIAKGLSEKVTVLGLSLGGIMAAWDAQFRSDVDTAVILVPSFAWYYLPRTVRPLINFSRLMPDMLLWWDPVKKTEREAPYSMYYKFSSRGMGHALTMGLSVIRAARKEAPACKDIIVMTNALDVAVDERTTRDLVRSWKARGARVRFYQFPKEMKMEHDVIDPLQPYEKTDRVYQTIFEHLEETSEE